jgi:Rad3-related DNA helicase
MLVYRDWFEIQGKLHRDTRTLTLSRYGLKIEGVEWIPLEEVLRYPTCRNTIDSLLQSIDQEPPILPSRSSIEEGKQELLDGLDTLEEIAREGIQLVRSFQTCPSEHEKIDLDLLNRIDERILSHQHRDIAGFLLAKTLLNLERSKPSTIEQTLENSLRIYLDLLDSIHYHREVLERNESFWEGSQDFTPRTDDSSGGCFTTL